MRMETKWLGYDTNGFFYSNLVRCRKGQSLHNTQDLISLITPFDLTFHTGLEEDKH